MGRRRNKSKGYKFTERRKSIRGIVSAIGAGMSLLLLLVMIVQSIASRGSGAGYFGSVGVVALFIAVASFVEAVQAVQEKDTYRTMPYVSIALSSVATVLWIALYLLGIVL